MITPLMQWCRGARGAAAQLLIMVLLCNQAGSGYAQGPGAEEPGAAADAPQAAPATPPAPKPIDEESVKKIYPSEGDFGRKFRETAAEFRCPTCTGLSVLESDARFSVQIKDLVLEQLQAGKSREEIRRYFTDRYGPWILREPPSTGFNMIAWLVPVAMMVLGPLGVWFFIWRRRRAPEGAQVRPVEQVVEEMQKRLAAMRAPGAGG